MKNNVFLIDDDKNILASISMLLENEGYKVSTFSDGESGLKAILENSPDIAVVDIKMPRLDGIELLKKLRRTSNMPVIFLTSKDQEQDEIIGLKMGAADYIKKPFSQKLLNERVRTVLRVHQNRNADVINNSVENKNFKKGDLSLDDLKQLCFWKSDIIELTVAEFNLIRSLSKHPGVIKDRNQLMDAMYGDTIYVDDRTIDSHIKRLRKKFKSYDPNFDQIRTRYGSGYSWRE